MGSQKKPVKRSDYLRNLRGKQQSGCTWCGADVPDPVTSASYCSDACVQADHEGVADTPPVIPLAWADPAYASRKWGRS